MSGLVLWTKAHKELLQIMQKYPKSFFLIYHQFADVKCRTDGILLLALVPQTLHERWTVTTSVSRLTTGRASCTVFTLAELGPSDVISMGFCLPDNLQQQLLRKTAPSNTRSPVAKLVRAGKLKARRNWSDGVWKRLWFVCHVSPPLLMPSSESQTQVRAPTVESDSSKTMNNEPEW